MNQKRSFGLRTPLHVLAAILLFGATTHVTSAQVYSVNIIGYSIKNISLVAPITLAYIANPLNTVDNRLSSVLPDVPNGTMIYAYRGNAFEPYTYFNGWLPADTTIQPGEGLIIALDRTTAPNPTSLAFVGEVAVGTLPNVIPPGASLKSSRSPRSGLIARDLALNPRDGDELVLFDENTQAKATYDFFDPEWLPFEPALRVAESFWYFNASGTANNWTQTLIPFSTDVLDVLADAPSLSEISAPQAVPCFAGPVLLNSARAASSQVRISWPGELGAFQLEHNTTLTGSWVSVSQLPETVQGRRQVTLPASSRDFYRLNSGPITAPVLYSKACDASTLTLFWHRSFSGFGVDQRSSLTSGSWSPLAQTPVDTNGFWQITVSSGSALQFYRLRQN